MMALSATIAVLCLLILPGSLIALLFRERGVATLGPYNRCRASSPKRSPNCGSS
jgi:hypothetical protein